MKEMNMIVWITQLGLSTALPLAGFVYLGYWLMTRCDLGVWVLFAGLLLGLICAVQGFINSLKLMEKQDKRFDAEKQPGTSFNDHD